MDCILKILILTSLGFFHTVYAEGLKEQKFLTALIKSMTLEEKVGQTLMVHFHGKNANQDSQELIQHLKVGGMIYYQWANELSCPSQVQHLSEGLQQQARHTSLHIPLLIAIDQEGGVVSRLQQGFTDFPGNWALGVTEDPMLAQQSAYAIGQELKAVGINMNLAPVVDVNVTMHNPVIGIRAFGSDPISICAFARHALNGYQEAQIIATLKHFPGHGDVQLDSHTHLPKLQKSLSELERTDLLPFKELASVAEVIMTAHLLVPSLDTNYCSTLSHHTLNYLREALGFKGVILSDSLAMQGVLDHSSSFEQAAIQALAAGCDMLLLAGRSLLESQSTTLEFSLADIQRIHRALVHAVKTGRITEARLNEAVERILFLKAQHLHHVKTEKLRQHQSVTTFEHQQLAQKIAKSALKITGDLACCSDLKKQTIVLIAPKWLQHNLEQTSFFNIGKTTKTLFFEDHLFQQQMLASQDFIDQSDTAIVFCHHTWKNNDQALFIQSVLDLGKAVIVISTSDPLTHFPQASLVLATFSPSLVSLQAAYKLLSGEHL